MERKIGEIFEYNGEWYQAVDNTNSIMCSGCAFVDDYNECEVDISVVGNCGCKDGNPLIFKKLEKVGEPFYRRWTLEGNNKLMQRYKIYTTPLITIDKQRMFYNLTNDFLEIEIKQTKEDMEENKLNLKPFDLEAAKAGKPVCTRDGRKARIICFDTKGDVCPIIALVEENGIESSHHYDKNGENAYNKSELDLMMLPEKKEGWLNLYPVDNPKYAASAGCAYIYRTREQARAEASEYALATVKVEWEE